MKEVQVGRVGGRKCERERERRGRKEERREKGEKAGLFLSNLRGVKRQSR